MIEFRNVLLGATTEGTLVFANIKVGGTREGYNDYFSASFSEVRPFLATYDYLRERAENYLYCGDKEFLYDMCERFDCRPSDLVDELVGEANYLGIEALVDVSLYTKSYRIGDYEDDIYFESEGGGQNDTRDILVPIDSEFSEWLHSLWDTSHLEKLTEEEYGNIIIKVSKYEGELEDIGEHEWIKDWLMENEELWS